MDSFIRIDSKAIKGTIEQVYFPIVGAHPSPDEVELIVSKLAEQLGVSVTKMITPSLIRSTHREFMKSSKFKDLATPKTSAPAPASPRH